jgi:hypothetical protein
MYWPLGSRLEVAVLRVVRLRRTVVVIVELGRTRLIPFTMSRNGFPISVCLRDSTISLFARLFLIARRLLVIRNALKMPDSAAISHLPRHLLAHSTGPLMRQRLRAFPLVLATLLF